MNTDRSIDKPSGEIRRNNSDIRDNDVNGGAIKGISSELSGKARQGKDDETANKLSGEAR